MTCMNPVDFLVIRYFRIEEGDSVELAFTKTPGIVTRDALVSYWPIFSSVPVTDPQVFANVNLVQFPSNKCGKCNWKLRRP